MHVALAIAVGVSVIAAYLALLATWSLSHDETLTRSGRVARVVPAWLVPIIGPMFLLRSAAELAPESLPAPAFTWPVRWLWAAGRPVRGDSGPGDAAGLDYGVASHHDQTQGHH
jgi:tellurite resistance protein TehA-like permease